MNVLRRNKRSLYLCKAYIEDNITKYKKPIKMDINYEPTSSSSQLLTYGISYPMHLIAHVLPSVGNMFKEGDKCYIFSKIPKEYDILAKDADYIVESMPLPTLNVVEIKFKRLSEHEA